MTTAEEKRLKNFAVDIRIQCINEISKVGVGHVGGCLSIVDTLACLYGGIMRIDPKNPGWDNRDRFILSKGHAGPALYAALALRGYFPMDMLNTLNQPPTNLPSHADKNRTPGVDMTTGSLGQGFSSAAGMALAGKLKGENHWIYTLLGDGECQEGQVWETAMFSVQKKLSKLIALIDCNGKQLDGTIERVGGNLNYAAIFAAFGWHVIEVANGHDVKEIWTAIQAAKERDDRPSVLILHTVKGKGWGYAERLENNHNFTVSPQQAAEAAAEFEQQRV